ncbi:hypothetical protein PMI13_00091 [Chryseobacterium populi]|uniref:Uncharacterized protein n=1 Tax=Chryseobacterium populi TaxID=1144316 RepID=J3CQD9_9FLAO|nr:hypothetical protein PMI13_00091 [Chryseobacterium populi]
MTETGFALHQMIQIAKMSGLDILYYAVIFINLIVSIVFKRLWKQYFWLYFGITVVIEVLISFKADFVTTRIYNYLDIFCIGYFGYLYFNELKKSEVIKIITLISILTGGVFIGFSKTNYSIITGFLYSIFLIFISLFWFYRKISKRNDKDNIIDLRFFWISSSLLLWSVFYIFRMFPMYFFVKSDLEFSYLLKTTFQIITIISYIIFFKGLLCKDEGTSV